MNLANKPDLPEHGLIILSTTVCPVADLNKEKENDLQQRLRPARNRTEHLLIRAVCGHMVFTTTPNAEGVWRDGDCTHHYSFKEKHTVCYRCRILPLEKRYKRI